MITRSSGQHVFIALGTPWIDALVAFLEPRARVDPWIMHGKMAIGDLLVTVLDTTPRTLLCIETVAAPFDGTSPMEVDERPYELHGLPTVPELEQRWSITFPTDPGPVDDALADRILTAYQSHYAHYFGDIDTLDPTSTTAHARALMNERGNCTGCSSPMPLRKFNSSDRLHFHSASRIFRQAEPGDDYPAVLCRKCTGRMATSGHTNFIDYMLAKNPSLPTLRCTQNRSVCTGDAGPSVRSPTVARRNWLRRGTGHPGMDVPSVQSLMGTDVPAGSPAARLISSRRSREADRCPR